MRAARVIGLRPLLVAAILAGVLGAFAGVAWADPPPPPPPPPPPEAGMPPGTPAVPPGAPPPPPPLRPSNSAMPIAPTSVPGATPGADSNLGPAPDQRTRPEEPPAPGWAVPDWDLDWRNRAAGLGPPLPPADPFDPQPIRYRPDTTWVTLDARRKTLNRVPQWVDVIHRRDLVAWRPLDIGTLASWFPNVMVGDAGNPSLQLPVIRGMGRERVKILTDGVWPASQALGFYGGTLSLWDPESTERVEIYHGPGAYLKGIDSPGGMINIVPRRPRRHGRLSADTAFATGYASASNRWRLRGEADVGQDRVAALVGVTWTTEGDRDIGGGDPLRPTNYHQVFADLAADYFLDNRSRVGVTAQYGSNYDVRTPTQTGSDIIEPSFERLFLAITLTSFDVGSIFGGTRASISIDSFIKEQDESFTNSPAGLGTEDEVDRYDIHFEGNLHILPCHETWSELTVSYARLKRTETILSDGTPCGGPEAEQGGCGVGVVRDFEAEEITLTWLLEDQYHNECWDFYGGVRFDWYHLEDNRDGANVDDFLVGGAVGVCRHFSERLTAFTNASFGWRRPTLFERTATVVVDGAAVFGSDDLDPEVHGNFELGMKGALMDRVSLQAAGFVHYFDDFITTVPIVAAVNNEQRLVNGGDGFNYGGELAAAWRPWTTIEGAELFGTVGITWSTSDDLVADVPLLYRAGIRHSVPTPRGYRVRRWFAEAALRGATDSVDGPRGDGAWVTADVLLGLGIDLGCFHRIDAGLGVTNLFDIEYVPPGAVLPAHGLSFIASLGLKF